MMHRIRRHVGGGIEPAPGNGLVKRGKALRDALRLAKFVQAVRVGIDPGHQFDPVDRRKRLGMRFRHAAGAKDQQTDRHQRNPSSPGLCSFGPRSVIWFGRFCLPAGSAHR